jgi:hypothetical protein
MSIVPSEAHFRCEVSFGGVLQMSILPSEAHFRCEVSFGGALQMSILPSEAHFRCEVSFGDRTVRTSDKGRRKEGWCVRSERPSPPLRGPSPGKRERGAGMRVGACVQRGPLPPFGDPLPQLRRSGHETPFVCGANSRVPRASRPILGERGAQVPEFWDPLPTISARVGAPNLRLAWGGADLSRGGCVRAAGRAACVATRRRAVEGVLGDVTVKDTAAAAYIAVGAERVSVGAAAPCAGSKARGEGRAGVGGVDGGGCGGAWGER